MEAAVSEKQSHLRLLDNIDTSLGEALYDEKNHHSTLPRARCHCNSLLVLIFTFLYGLLVVIWWVTTLQPHYSNTSSAFETAAKVYFDGPRDALVGHRLQVPPATRIFDLVDKAYAKAISDKTWTEDMAEGGGYVSLEEYGKEGTFVISGFHQLHCLQALQETFQDAITSSTPLDHHRITHFYHCTGEIREAILCCADPTLDKVSIGNKTGLAIAWGNGIHVCRDWNLLKNWAEEFNSGTGVQ